MMRRVGRSFLAVALAAGTVCFPTGSAVADNGTESAPLRTAVTTAGIMVHLNAFQMIATANGGTRSAGTPGHVASAEYVAGKLQAAGYRVTRQPFTYIKWFEDDTPVLSGYVAETDFSSMSYSGSGSVTATVQGVDIANPPSIAGGSTSGCEAADFAGFVSGSIALIQRGTCEFGLKALNAENAGAVGVIIFNEGNAPDRTDLLFGTLGSPGVSIPVVGSTYAVGAQLAATPSTRTLGVTSHKVPVNTYNVLADTTTGRTDRMVVAGGHLDSVAEGAGINDNGSGTASLLEIALQMSALRIQPRNQVRFAFWSGEEDGLIGSQYYVDQLSNRDAKRHALNLNFDMVASPNFGRFIYDGDGSASEEAGPNGSDIIESVFTDYFASKNLSTLPTAFDGRSDYGPFIDRGIPAGGLFTGAEDIKTAAEAALFGGIVGAPFDPCYHDACDGIGNINTTALDQMSDAMSHAILSFGQTTAAINGTGQGSGSGHADFLRKGNRFVK